MQINPNAIQTDLQNILKDVIDSIPTQGAFDENLKSAKKDPASKVVEIGELKFRVDVEDRVESSLNEASIKTTVKEDAPKEAKADTVDAPEKPLVKSDSEGQKPGVHPGVTLNFQLLDPSKLLSKLPNAVRSLIDQTVQVIKVYRQDISDVQYKFKFSHINMEVSVADVNDKLQIKISVQDAELKKDMFSEENQKMLLLALQKEFQDEDIELIFVDEQEKAMNSQSEDSDQNQREPEQEVAEPEDEN